VVEVQRSLLVDLVLEEVLNRTLIFFILYYFSVFRPISASAKLQMNRRSDFDFSDPKINLAVDLHTIAIEFNKPQVISFDDI
jgi:hypothetical protein